jgi:hypothetical protein
LAKEFQKRIVARMKLDDYGKLHIEGSADISKAGSAKTKCHNETVMAFLIFVLILKDC